MKKVVEKRVFRFDRATRNTYRFVESVLESEESFFTGPMYVQQSVFEGKRPNKIMVTVEVE